MDTTQLLISIVGVIISFLIYRLHTRVHDLNTKVLDLNTKVLDLNTQKEEDKSISRFMEWHKNFWEDPNMALVRKWLACESEYLKIQPILEKRKNIDLENIDDVNLTGDEYNCLEYLDQFFNRFHNIILLNDRTSLTRIIHKIAVSLCNPLF